jgi:PhnB protein
MMNQLIPYLTFAGNCRQAMNFYWECLGGELYFQTVRESPMSEKLSDRMKDCILHSTLKIGKVRIHGSDMVGEKGLVRGNTVSLLAECDSEMEIRSIYEKLSSGGEASHPIESTFWGSLFGGLTDKFDNHWLLNYPGK